MTEPIDREPIDRKPTDPELIEAGAHPDADGPEQADDPEQADGQVAAALAELAAAADWPPADQVAAFTAAHDALQATLARIDNN